MCKHKKGNANTNKWKSKNAYANESKRKSEHANTKTNKMSRHNVNNNNGVKRKPLRRNVLYSIPIVPSPTATDVSEKKKKHFVRKYKSAYIKHVYTNKFLMLLLKLDMNNKLIKTHKFVKSNKTTGIPHAKSKLRETIILVKDVITLDPNTMKNNTTTN